MKCASKKIDPNNFTDKEKESYEQFKKGGMLVEDTLNEQDRVKLKFLQSTYSPNSLGYTLLPTMACNFKCKYCWEVQAQERGEFKPVPFCPAREIERAARAA